MNLSRDTTLLACCMYREYKKRRKDGIPKDEALWFTPDFKNEDPKTAIWTSNEYGLAIAELKDAGLVEASIDSSASLENEFVSYMENRFTNGLKGVLKFIADFVP